MKFMTICAAAVVLFLSCLEKSTGPAEPEGPFNLTATASSPAAAVVRIPDLEEYPAGDTVMLIITPAPGYLFHGWTGDASGVSDTLRVVMDRDKTVLADIKSIAGVTVFSVLTASGNGTIVLTPPGGVYDSGTVVTAAARPDYGFLFSGWSGDVSSSDTLVTFAVSGNTTVGAAFDENPNAVFSVLHISPAVLYGAVETRPPGIPTADGWKFMPGITVALEPVPQPGYAFVRWTGEAAGADSAVASLQIAMNMDRTVSAVFEPIPIGSEWIRAESGTRARLNMVIWTGSRLYVAGDSGTILTSSDGRAWSKLSTDTDEILVDMVWTGTRLAAVTGGGEIVTSETGASWTLRSGALDADFKAIGWTGSLLVAAGMSGEFATSSDGIEWTVRQTGIMAFRPTAFERGGDRLYLGGYATARAYNSNNYEGRVYYTTDGISWTDYSPGYDCNSIMDLAWTGDALLAVGTNGEVFSKSGGTFWYSNLWDPDYITPWGNNLGLGDLYAVIWTGTTSIAAGQQGTIIVSEEGYLRRYEERWQPPQSHTFLAMTWMGTRAVVVGALGVILYTP